MENREGKWRNEEPTAKRRRRNTLDEGVEVYDVISSLGAAGRSALTLAGSEKIRNILGRDKF